MDLWGRIYTDHWRGEAHPHAFLRDDGKSDTVRSAGDYFVAPRGAAEKEALSTLAGRVLDLGCGPGSYALFLQDRGVAVTAIDSSPGAIAVCQERGCHDARQIAIDDLLPELGSFDAIICMGNTLGIGLSPETLPRRLAMLRALSEPAGRLLAVVRDPLSTQDPDHLAYHARNRAAGRPPGLVRTRLQYRDALGEWGELWMPTEPELRLAAGQAGWTVRCVMSEGGSRLYNLSLSRAN
jgi:SAM-dependent methyltransferase